MNMDASAGTKRNRPSRSRKARSKATSASDDANFSVRLALRVLWAALSNDSIRLRLFEHQGAKLEALIPVLRRCSCTISCETDRILTISCGLQLAWHQASFTATAAVEAPHKARRGRAQRDARDELEQLAAKADDAKALAREMLSEALDRAMLHSPASGEGVLMPIPACGGSNVEDSPGEARPKARARISGPSAEDREVNAAFANEPPRVAMRTMLTAWAAEGCVVGLFDNKLAETAAAFTASSLRLARSAGGHEAAALAHLLPHASKLIVQACSLTCDSSHP